MQSFATTKQLLLVDTSQKHYTLHNLTQNIEFEQSSQGSQILSERCKNIGLGPLKIKLVSAHKMIAPLVYIALKSVGT